MPHSALVIVSGFAMPYTCRQDIISSAGKVYNRAEEVVFMIKMASGVVARAGGPRGLMWALMAVVAIGVPALYWMSYVENPFELSGPLEWWLLVNAILVPVFSIVCGIGCNEDNFDWEDIDRPLVIWALMADWSDSDQPSWLRLIVWMFLIPAELVATLVLRPITLAVRALLNPMPGGWD